MSLRANESKRLASLRVWRAALKRPVLAVFCLALLVRLGAILLIEQLPPGTFALDDSTYSGLARDVAEQSRGGWDAYAHQLHRATFVFVTPLAAIYSVFGSFSVFGEVFVAILGTGVAALVAFTASRFMAPVWSLAAGVAVALLPSQVLWSSLLLKDPSVWIGLAALGATAAIAARATDLRWLGILALAAAGALFYLAFLREHTLVVAAWSLPLAMAFSAKGLRLHRIAGGIALMIAVPWIVGIGPVGWTLITNAGALETRRALNAQAAASAFVEEQRSEAPPADSEQVEALRGDIDLKRQLITKLEEQAQELREKAAAGGGGTTEASAAEVQAARQKAQEAEEDLERLRAEITAEETRLKELVGGSDIRTEEAAPSLDPDVVHLPKGLFVMLFEPVPWSTEGSTTMRLARLESLVWYPLLALAAIGLHRARRLLWALAFPILAGGGMLFVYALTEGNIGTAYRHRGEFVWVVCLLAGLGASQVATWRANRRMEIEEQR